MKKRLLFLVFYLIVLPISSQKIVPDSSMMDTKKRGFDKEMLKSYENNPNYIYDDDAKSSENPIKAWWHNIWKNFTDYMEEATSPYLWKIIRFLIIIGVILLIVHHLSHSGKSGILSKKDDVIQNSEVRFEPGDLKASDIDNLLANLESNSQYRMAIRWLYLKTIKNLGDKGLIKWSDKTTNFNLLAQLREGKIKDDFRDLIQIYEYAWYGKHDLETINDYTELKSKYDVFNHSILSVS